MSSKGRTIDPTVGEGREFHPTPAWPHVTLAEKLSLPDGDYLEIGAGEGSLIRGFHLARPGLKARWTAIEKHAPCEARLREVAAEVAIGDARVVVADFKAHGRRFNAAVFNPPFSLAFELVLLALEICDYVVMLQRTPWVGDDLARQAVFTDNLPDDYRIGRVSFDREGSDSVPCSWMVWTPQNRGQSTGRYCLLRRPTKAELKVELPRTVAFPVEAEQCSLFGLDAA